MSQIIIDNRELLSQNVHIWDGHSSREYLDSIGFQHREKNDLGPILMKIILAKALTN